MFSRIDHDLEEMGERVDRRKAEMAKLDRNVRCVDTNTRALVTRLEILENKSALSSDLEEMVKDLVGRVKELEEDSERHKTCIRKLSFQVVALEDKGRLDEGTLSRMRSWSLVLIMP